jgi:hypothetical protein
MEMTPMWSIIVPSHEPGGPLRVVANRPEPGPRRGYYPGLCLSARRPPARFRDWSDAVRIAAGMRRDVGRPIIVEAGAV